MKAERVEALLRQAPRPVVPATLKNQLIRDIPLRISSKETAAPFHPGLWLRRWFPALAFGVLCLGCLIVLVAESSEFISLRQERDRLRATASTLEQLRAENATLRARQAEVDQASTMLADYRNLLDLRKEAERWRELQLALEGLQDVHDQLQREYAKSLAAARALRGPDPFAEAEEKAHRIKCISNIKQIGLAARLWSIDHEDLFPNDFLTMSNELNSPRILICPADSKRLPATNWTQFDTSHVSYQMLSPGVPVTDPNIVFVQCPLHRNIGLTDGSAQMLGPDAKLTTVNGVTRWERPQP